MQIWALKITEGEGAGSLVGAMDCAGDPKLFYACEADAAAGAKAHAEMYDIDCTPILLGDVPEVEVVT